MPKINQEEYEVLKELDDKWKWIARDESEGVFLFVEKPNKYRYLPQWRNHTCDWKTFETEVFQFIQWENEEPYNISELIEEHEISLKYQESVELGEQVIRGHIKNQLKDESEETEVKNIEWLRKDFDRIFDQSIRINSDKEWDKGWNVGWYEARTTVYALINQLDEPEVLSQEWIDEHTYYNHNTGEDIVYVDDLKDLLVPEQEEVDRAYKDGYEKGKQHTFYKGYLEGLADKENEPETIADVVTTFWKSFERLKEVMSKGIS